jgi:hypothetical protein
VVKPDYGVVVDYVYGKGQHRIVRSFAIPSSTANPGTNSAEFAVAPGKTLRLQTIDPANATIIPTASGKRVDFSCAVTTPAPVSTVFLAWTGTAAPKVEYVKPANPLIVKFKVTFPDGRVDQVALGWEARPLHLSGKEFKGWAACLRQGPAGTSSIEIN